MAIKIKSPNSDEIWEKWKQSAVKSQNLEKHYGIKGAQFSLENITAAEFVKNVEKGVIFYYEESEDIQPSRSKPEKITQKASKIEKVTFYQFSEKVNKENWKYDEMVPLYNSLEKVACKTCQGSGGIKCSKCNGSGKVVCSSCKGDSSTLKCKTCNGSGTIVIEVEVIDHKGNKTKKQTQVLCKDCLGKKQIICSKCNGYGKVICSYCNGMGVNTCSDCKGFGYLYNYTIGPVPFKESHVHIPKLISSLDMKGLEKEIGLEIQKTIESVEGILIQKPNKELDKKFIEPNLGFFEKPEKKAVKTVIKDWKNAEKNTEINIRLPIYLFPVLCLESETKKGKKFKIYAIGSDRKYRVFGKI